MRVGKLRLCVGSFRNTLVTLCAVAGYTREAGVRCLEREIATVCRTAAVKVTISYSCL